MMQNRIDIISKIAIGAGKILLQHFGSIEENYKNESFDVGSIVTDADLESEKYILDELKAAFPGDGIYGEESGEAAQGEDIWYVDPLDGTSLFARNIPLFGISIGLLKNQTDAQAGVLYFPAINLLVSAEKGQGAFANGKRINTSQRLLNRSLYYSGGYYKQKLQLVNELLGRVGFIKVIDASSYELAQIAMGDAELYVMPSVLHDVVAGVAIVQEAGGRVTDAGGNDWSAHSKTIVVSNGPIHNEVIKLLPRDLSEYF